VTALAPSRRRATVWLLLVPLLTCAWLGLRAYQLWSGLTEARSALAAYANATVKGDGSRADGLVAEAAKGAGAARQAVDDPLWQAAAAVPLIGRSFAVGRGAAEVAEIIVYRVIPPTRHAAARLQEATPLVAAGRVNLEQLRVVHETLAAASAAALAARQRADALPSRLLPPPVGAQRDDLVAVVDRLSASLGSLDAALALAPRMLGGDGPRRYFLAVQNNAEARGTGGLIGAYAVLRADKGKVTRERVGTNQDFVSQDQPVVDLGPEFANHYDVDGGRTEWSAVGLTPDWPNSAQVIAGLWKAQGGGHIDGVIGMDPVAMSSVLRVTGPVTRGGLTVSGADVVDFVLRDEYSRFQERDAERKQLLADLASGLYDRVTSGTTSPARLIRPLAQAASGGHLQVYSAHAEEQAVIAPLRVSGALPAGRGAFLEVVSNNAAGNKIEYYIRRRVEYARAAPDEARVTLTLRNNVRAGAVPPLVTGRLDHPAQHTELGATRQIVTLYVGVEQHVRAVRIDGKPAHFDSGTEREHGWATVQVEIAPSRPTIVSADVDDPGGRLLYRQQPLAFDDELALRVPHRIG
jgi:hypothetical protein